MFKVLTSSMSSVIHVRLLSSPKYRLATLASSRHVKSCTCLRPLAGQQKLFASHSSLYTRTVVTSSTHSQRLSANYKKATSSDHVLRHAAPEKEVVNSDEKVGIFKRFKNAYKEHGKVLVAVHIATSTVWISIFYYAAASGVDLVPLLQKIGASEKIIQIANSSIGNLATAYLMYKLATPARYTVTLFGTFSTVKYLHKLGYMKKPEKKDSIRELMKDGRIQMKEKYGDVKEKIGDWKDEKLKKKQR